MSNLIERLSNEADLCRNDGAHDIANLLDEAVTALKPEVMANGLTTAREALKQIAAMDPNNRRADDLGRAARIARDALDVRESDRLEAELGLDVLWHNQCVFVGRRLHRPGSEVFAEEFANHAGDKHAALRRAIERASQALTKSIHP